MNRFKAWYSAKIFSFCIFFCFKIATKSRGKFITFLSQNIQNMLLLAVLFCRTTEEEEKQKQKPQKYIYNLLPYFMLSIFIGKKCSGKRIPPYIDRWSRYDSYFLVLLFCRNKEQTAKKQQTIVLAKRRIIIINTNLKNTKLNRSITVFNRLWFVI